MYVHDGINNNDIYINLYYNSPDVAFVLNTIKTMIKKIDVIFLNEDNNRRLCDSSGS